MSGDLNFSLSFVQVGVNTEIRGSNNFVLALLLNVNASILKAGNFLGNVPAINNQGTTNILPVATAPTPVTTPTPALLQRLLLTLLTKLPVRILKLLMVIRPWITTSKVAPAATSLLAVIKKIPSQVALEAIRFPAVMAMTRSKAAKGMTPLKVA